MRSATDNYNSKLHDYKFFDCFLKVIVTCSSNKDYFHIVNKIFNLMFKKPHLWSFWKRLLKKNTNLPCCKAIRRLNLIAKLLNFKMCKKGLVTKIWVSQTFGTSVFTLAWVKYKVLVFLLLYLENAYNCWKEAKISKHVFNVTIQRIYSI